MSPTAKAMYGSTNTGDKAADRLGAVVNTVKKSVVGPEDEHKALIGTLQGVAGGLSGVLGYKSSIRGMDRQGRRMQLIQALDAKAGTLPKGSQQRAILKRMRDNL